MILDINPIIIGITGSYGKTSCKNILKNLLSDDFLVECTEKNYNTPIGVALSVEKLPKDTEVFIAEYGARKRGDIEELCELFPPKYGIITGICEQHLETFGSLENIIREKGVLAEKVSKDNGVCVFNINDKNVFKIYKSHKGKKFSAGCNKKSDVYCTDIKLFYDGSVFKLHFGQEIFLCKTPLLGRHNVQNIVLCSALAFEMGVSPQKIVAKIEKLPQIKHRLEYIYNNGVHILDDSYNANSRGVVCGVEVLSLFDARKIVVAQGIVELGEKSKEENEKIGSMLGKVADVVILCGTNVKFIENGLKIVNFDGEIIKEKSFNGVKKDIKQIVKPGDVLYLQNDIPDIY